MYVQCITCMHVRSTMYIYRHKGAGLSVNWTPLSYNKGQSIKTCDCLRQKKDSQVRLMVEPLYKGHHWGMSYRGVDLITSGIFFQGTYVYVHVFWWANVLESIDRSLSPCMQLLTYSHVALSSSSLCACTVYLRMYKSTWHLTVEHKTKWKKLTSPCSMQYDTMHRPVIFSAIAFQVLPRQKEKFMDSNSPTNLFKVALETPSSNTSSKWTRKFLLKLSRNSLMDRHFWAHNLV